MHTIERDNICPTYAKLKVETLKYIIRLTVVIFVLFVVEPLSGVVSGDEVHVTMSNGQVRIYNLSTGSHIRTI
jgi:hypothetical protein